MKKKKMVEVPNSEGLETLKKFILEYLKMLKTPFFSKEEKYKYLVGLFLYLEQFGLPMDDSNLFQNIVNSCYDKQIMEEKKRLLK